MKRFFRLFVVVTTFAWVCIFPALATAQQAELRIRQVGATLATTPQIQSDQRGGRVSGQTAWIRLDVIYDTTVEWADDLRFEFFVLGSDGAQNFLLTGQETYMNVARGNQHTASMFIHPNTVKRYFRGQNARKITVDAYYQNRLVDRGSNPVDRTEWWKQLQAMTGLVVSRMQTPWAVLNNDSYESIKGQ